ncbi:fimbrial protein [Escherichia coli]
MKRLHKRFLLATFCALFTATLQAADVTITVNGRVVAKPCTIQTKEANVNLGDLYTRNLQQPGSASGWHNITLSLTDCPVETSAVTAIVTGSTDNTGYYKNEGTAENIQIELRDDQDATLKNGDSKTVIVDEITRNAQFPLKARAITVNGNASQGTIEALINVIYTWNNVTYPFPLTTNTNVLDIGDKTPMPLPLKLYITPVGAAGGVVIKAGEVIARIHMYKIATLGSGNPRNFTWNIISNNSVVMPTGGCTVDSRNVTVDLPDFPGSAEIPLGVYCSSEQKLSFYLSGATTDSARQVFANTAPDATKASGVGVSLMRNGKILATGENVSLGTVNKSKVPLGLSATYGQTGNKVSAGTVQSVIGVTFIYE